DIRLEKVNIAGESEEHSQMPKETTNLKEMNILLVEDNKVNVFVCENFLKKWGVKNDVAENGAMGVEMARKTNYDLILMDIQMPVMDGYEASNAIRAFNPDVPIVAL